MMEISKDFEFEAAHSLPHLPYTHKCHNLHGHSYKLRVTCAGELDPGLGWVIVHVGRVNSGDDLEYCERVGAESCDGSGFFRESDGPRSNELRAFIEGRRRYENQGRLSLTA